MIREKELDLLIDLLKLRKKYGEQSFLLLSKELSSPEMSKQISELLSNIPSKLKTSEFAINKKINKKTSIPRALSNLETEDPKKYKLLSKFFDDLAMKSILPSLADIKFFAEDLGLAEIRLKSRNGAINSLITSLASLPLDKIISKLQTSGIYQKETSSLEGWSDIILPKKEK